MFRQTDPRLRRAALVFFLCMVAGYTVWWCGLNRIAYTLLYPAVSWILPILFDGYIAQVNWIDDAKFWLIQTGLEAVSSEPGRKLAVFQIEFSVNSRLLEPFPATLALLLATPDCRPRDLLIGASLFALMLLAAICGGTWHILAVIVGNQASPFYVLAPVHTLTPPWPDWLFYLSGIGFNYWMVMPFLAPPLIWVILFKSRLPILISQVVADKPDQCAIQD